MRDVGFSQHGGLQDGTGDPSMMELLHKFMKVLAVSLFGPYANATANSDRLSASSEMSPSF